MSMNVPEWMERESIWFLGKEEIGYWKEIEPGQIWAETAISAIETLAGFHPNVKFRIMNHSDFENRHIPYDDDFVCVECETQCRSDWKCICCQPI